MEHQVLEPKAAFEVFCKGMLTLECMEYYGCDDAGEAYSWCEVDEASCPESSRDLLLGPGA